MSEVYAPRHGGWPPQSRNLLICEKTWIAMRLAPLPDAPDRQIGRISVPGDDARHVMPCQQPWASSGHGAAALDADLLLRAVRSRASCSAEPDVVE